MHRLLGKKAAIVIVALFAAAGVVSGTSQSIHVQAQHTVTVGVHILQRSVPSSLSGVQRGVSRTACAVLGAYHIGPDLAEAQSGTSSGPATPTASSKAATPARAGTIYVSPAFLLQGTLTLSSYTGCAQSNQPTLGTFSIERGASSSPIEQPRGQGMGTACPLKGSCGFPVAGIMNAAGSFTQDAAHAGDPLYVTVSAVITTTRRGPERGIPCSVQRGCPPSIAITSTITMTNVTGYLQATTSNDRYVVLSFLPPPASAAGLAPAPLALYGRRDIPVSPNPARATPTARRQG